MKAGDIVHHVLDDKPMVVLNTKEVTGAYILCVYASGDGYIRDWFYDHELKITDFISPTLRQIITDEKEKEK